MFVLQEFAPARFCIFFVLSLLYLGVANNAEIVAPGILADAETNQPARVTLYEHEQFSGYRKNLQLTGECLNLYEPWNDHGSSIDPHESCIFIWQNHNCAGRVVRLQKYRYGTERLAAIGMNDEISSISLC